MLFKSDAGGSEFSVFLAVGNTTLTDFIIVCRLGSMVHGDHESLRS